MTSCKAALGFPGGANGKEPTYQCLPPTRAGDVRNVGLVAGLGRSPGGGNSNLLQYSCLQNSMVRGAWQAIVQSVTKSQM